MMSQTGSQTIAIHISPSISQSKGNQTMKLGQLTEHNKSKTFLQKLYRKSGKETKSRHLYFLKKLNMR